MDDHDKPMFNPRISDDPMHRLMMQAEARARRNGATDAAAHAAGRKAMMLRRALLDLRIEPNAEHILETVAGPFRRLTTV